MFKAVILVCLLGTALAIKEFIVGGIFHGDDDITEMAFKYAIERVNFDQTNYELVPKIYRQGRQDSFRTQRIVCELAAEGAVVIFGPSSIETSGVAAAICEKLEIPNIIYHWGTKALGEVQSTEHTMTINLYPDSDVLSKAFAHVLVDYTWKGYTIIYENEENLIRMKDVLQIHGPDSPVISVRQLGDGPDYGPLLKEIHSTGESHIVLDISAEKIVPFLRNASKVKMLGDYNSYYITNLDMHTLDMGELSETTANITCLRLIDPNNSDLQNAVNDWKQREKIIGNKLEIDPSQVPTEAGLIHDAVQVFTKALNKMLAQKQVFSKLKHNCSEPRKNARSTLGSMLGNFMKTQDYEGGTTGKIMFSDIRPHKGFRTEFRLEILQLSKQKFRKIGSWGSTLGVHYDRDVENPEDIIVEAIGNKTFNIVVKLGKPFLMDRVPPTGEVFEGNQRFEGYIVDLINQIAQMYKFKFNLEKVPDGKYGAINKETKKWDGLVKHLLDRKADLAVADLTINYERKTAVDFTMPFMTLGISILYTKPVKTEPDLFSFLKPFTVYVWILTGVAYLGVSVTVFVLSRMANEEWESSHPCNQDAPEVESIWGMMNCIWLCMGSIMGQGCDILPKGVSTRIVTGMWWFFALIMLASYTANLAAFLTNQRIGNSIDSAEDLAKQSKIKYGAMRGGSTMKFFQDSNFSTYQRMWAAMESNGDDVHNLDNDVGRERVIKDKGNYALLMESVPLEYITERYCDLTKIGLNLDSKGYGIALPLNSPYRKTFSEAILKLQELGTLNTLKDKWWKAEKQCPVEEPDDGDLGIENVGGVFVVLGAGCLIALAIACGEFLWNVQNLAVEERISPWDALKSEMAFAFNIWITTKPVHGKSNDEIASRKSTPPRSIKSMKSLKSRSRYGSETRSLRNKSMRSLNYDDGIEATSRSLLNLN